MIRSKVSLIGIALTVAACSTSKEPPPKTDVTVPTTGLAVLR